MSRSNVVCVIPARLESTRFPKKLLQTIQGKSLLEFVYLAAKQSKAVGRVIVACDHQEIRQCVAAFGGEAVMTSARHTNGTERIAEVAATLDAELIVNVQADEPLMNPETINRVVEALQKNESCVMSTACISKNDAEGYEDSHVVKVTKDGSGWALYFSRSPIPKDRDGNNTNYFKHLGIYGYQRRFLLEYAKLPASKLEQREKLEQLRALENGVRIQVVETVHDSIGVDTRKDFELVRSVILNKDRVGATHA